MAKPTWSCSGCDGVFATRKIDEWRTLRVEILSAGGSVRLSESFDLCPDCQVRIVKLADPRNWPRAKLDLPAELRQVLSPDS
jgi:hypothetical protein